jgi:hypothetical protein
MLMAVRQVGHVTTGAALEDNEDDAAKGETEGDGPGCTLKKVGVGSSGRDCTGPGCADEDVVAG